MDQPVDLLLPSQSRLSGQTGYQYQGHSPNKGGGHGQHGEGHAAQDAKRGHGVGHIHPARHQTLGHQHRRGRPHQVAQHRRGPHRKGDGSDAPSQPRRRADPGNGSRPAAVGEHQSAGRKDLADGHPKGDQTHGPLFVLGQKEDQKPQDRPGADELLQHLHRRRKPHRAAAVKIVFMEIFHPREQQAGEEDQQSQTGAGVAQQIDRDGVGAKPHHHRRHHEKANKNRQTPAEHRSHDALLPQGPVLRREIGHRRRQPDGRHRQQHRLHRQDQLIKSHHLRSHQAGEKNPIKKAQHLPQQSCAGEEECSTQK